MPKILQQCVKVLCDSCAFRDRIYRYIAFEFHEGKKCERQLNVVVLYEKKEQNALSKDDEECSALLEKSKTSQSYLIMRSF